MTDGAALLQAILDDPTFSAGGDPTRWLVYADWLQANDDPRGAWMAAQIAAGDDATHDLPAGAPWLAPFDRDPLAALTDVHWHRGFWRSARVGLDRDGAFDPTAPSVAEATAQLLVHPSAVLLHELVIGLSDGWGDGQADWRPVIAAIAAAGPRPSLRWLEIGDFVMGDDTEVSWTTIGSLGRLWAALPRLERLEVQGGHITLGDIDAPTLEALTLRTGGLPAEPVEALIRARLPRLEHLALWFGDHGYGGECTAELAGELLQSPVLAPVRSLGLCNAEFTDELVAMLLAGDVLARLQELDLSFGTLTDAGGRSILANADRFRHLTSLNLDFHHLSPKVSAALHAALPQASLDDPQGPGDPYVAVGE